MIDQTHGKVVPAPEIEGVVRVFPTVYPDDRGLFVETWRQEWFPGTKPMIQANRADRAAGCIVGLHHHLHQSDYWYVPNGTVRVVLHDLREGSPTDGTTMCFDLGGPEHGGVYIPPGVAHGFAALTDATITYLVDGYYDPSDELGVAWDDPDVAADWGVSEPMLSKRDQDNPRRRDLPEAQRPRWSA